MRILIVSGGALDLEWASAYLEEEEFDRVIAADSGLAGCDRLGLMPTDILGDFDSLKNPAMLDRYEGMVQGPVRHYPERKDYTDTHLAMQLALEYRPDEVVLIGAAGSRLDHTLANLSLLAFMEEKGVHTLLMDPNNIAEVMIGPAERTFARAFSEKTDREYLSLIAVSSEVRGICLEGFSYPLENGVLRSSISLGISNELLGKQGRVRIGSGTILVIRARD